MCVYCMFIYVLESVQHIGQRTVALNCALEINSLALPFQKTQWPKSLLVMCVLNAFWFMLIKFC